MPPPKQSRSIEQFLPSAHGVQNGPPQSMSVSLPSIKSLVQVTMVGAGIGVGVGPGEGAGDGAGDGEKVSIDTPVTTASDMPLRRRRRASNGGLVPPSNPTNAAVNEPSVTAASRVEAV